MATTTTTTNKPLNPRAQDLSPKGYNRAALFSGKALSFDGVNDAVEVADNNNLDFATNFSIVQYVKLSAAQTSRIFYSNYASSATGAATGISDSTNNVVKFYTKGAGTSNTLFSSFALNTNDWYYIVATYDGATKKIYINGKLDASVTYTDSVTYTSATPRVGALSGVSAQFLNGLLSGVKVFNTALTAAQVADLYLNPEKITPDGVATSALKLWLPMMEGAGASAYDGSGNGNDGTINGATWTSGVGAPVAQTALVSWNKGVNLVQYSEQLNQSSFWNAANITITTNDTTAPNGTTTAEKVAVSGSGTLSPNLYSSAMACTSGVNYKISYFAKQGTSKYAKIRFSSTAFSGSSVEPIFDLNAGVVTSGTGTIESVGNGWYLISATDTAVASASGVVTLDLPSSTGVWPNGSFAGTEYIYAWGYSFRPTSAGDAYIKTNATAQTSAVLVPEGLTAGASIFGTDIITPRNAFALNLDGASWAQVGDNASLDITAAVTLEAWVYWDGTQVSKGILGRYSNPDFSFLLYANSGTRVDAYFAQSGSTSYTSMAVGWRHIVGTFDGNIQIVYIDGVNVASAINPHTMSAGTTPIEIGRYSQNVSVAYGNQLANPRIYNRALTAAEVLRNYNADKAKFGL